MSLAACLPGRLSEGYSILKPGFDRLNLTWSCIFEMASSKQHGNHEQVKKD